jgi:hypothetical protein
VRISDDGQTVLDEVTGLAWQRKPNTTSYTSFAKARAYCEGLALDGHADWRLPGFIELASLFPADQIGTYDPKVFPDGLPSYLFTASPVQNEAQSGTASSHIWVVDTKEPRPYVEPMEPTPFPYSALCVRTASIPEVGLPDARFQADAVHDSVQDLRTGLVWQRTVEDLPRTFEQARSYCGALRQAGAAWRLPTLGEGLSIVDVGGPTVRLFSAFQSQPDRAFWTSSSSSNQSVIPSAPMVTLAQSGLWDFVSQGTVSTFAKLAVLVRCVQTK